MISRKQAGRFLALITGWMLVSSASAQIPTVAVYLSDSPLGGAYTNYPVYEGTTSGYDTTYLVFWHNMPGFYYTVPVDYSLTGSTASSSDYSPTLSGSINIPGGTNLVAVPVRALLDASVESTETLNVRLTAKPGYYYLYPGLTNCTAQIYDDTPRVHVYCTNAIFAEGTTTALVFERTNAFTVSAPCTNHYSISGTAANGSDYTPTLSGTAIIPAGSLYTLVSVTGKTDTAVEGVETANVTLTSGTYQIISGEGSTTLTLQDDYATVNVEATDNQAAESGANTGTFTLTRDGNTNQAITVQLSFTGTAIAGTDYTAIPTNITMAAGVVTTNLSVTPIADGSTEAAETVVLNLKTNAAYVLGLHTNAVVTLIGEGANPRDSYPLADRYQRGSGTNLAAYSIVVPLDGIKGTRRLDVETNGFFSSYSTAYHYDATNSGNQSFITNRIQFNTPIVSFGGGWGTPLYIGQSYSLGIYKGISTADPITIYAFRHSDGGLEGTVNLSVPNIGNSADWTDFATNGFTRSVSGHGLTTVLRGAADMTWGIPDGVGWALTHTATEAATNYAYLVTAAGYYNGQYMVLNGAGQGAIGYFYDLNFAQRPGWRSIFVDQPHFQTDPLPPDLWNKTPEELLNHGAAVSNSIALSPTACTNLDQSPELRRHPILDQLVADLNNDPIALANYVQNEIDLTDAIAYRDDGSVSTESINEGGVNRGAVGVYLEGEGSPVEQCALLIYLLRQAGYPAAYVFPPEGGVKMLDTRLSALLRMRLNGAQDYQGHLYTTNSLITVNYPWVAAYIGTNWVHLFPWIKDTGVEEGLNLYDYLPAGYKDTQLWVRDYILGKTNLLAFATPDDDTPGIIFPRWLDDSLKQNAPGISLDDIGMRYVNRRHLYAEWSAFPRPTWVTNTSTAVESLGSASITNVSPALTNLFDTVQVELYSEANPQKKIQTATLRMADLHNRLFYLTHTNGGSGQIQAILTLGPYRPSATNSVGSFSASDTTLTNKQVLTLTLDSTDDHLKLRLRHRRQRALTWETALDPARGFLDLWGAREVVVERPLRMGDVAAICFNTGRVTPAMLRVHAQQLWNMEQLFSTNAVATNQVSPDVYQGSLVYLVGMSYYERGARYDDTFRRLFKVQDISQFAMGLAKISPRRNADGTLYNGTVDPIWPNVDMFYQEVVNAGNGSVRLDSGWDYKAARRNYFNLSIADLSAQEHATLNIFYGQSNAVSTVKLLQLAALKAQSGGSNVVELTPHNYLAAGNTPYAGKYLKDHDPSLWSQVTGLFEQPGTQGFVVGWMPPGPQTNASGSFAGMGALVIGADQNVALIGNNQYGAYGDSLNGMIQPYQLSQWNLQSDLFGNYNLNLSDPTPATWQPAYESSSSFNVASDFGLLNSGSLLANPYQAQAGSLASWLYNDTPGTYLSTYSQVTDLGWLGVPDSREGNSFLGTIADPVNTMSGEFYVDDVDLTLPGPMPLQMRRNYGSHNLAANQLGYGWKLNYMPYLSVSPDSEVIYAAEPDGSVLAFGLVGTNLWAPTPALNPSLNNNTKNGIGSVANQFNARLAKTSVGSTNYYTLTNGDGSRRVFQEMSFPLTNSTSWDRLRPYLTTWHDNRSNYYRFEYGTNAGAADYGQVRRIVSSSGNVVRFLYDVQARVVEAYSLDGRRVQYEFDDHGDLRTVIRPDGSELGYEYQLANWTTNGVTNVYSTHLLTRELKPDGRVLRNEYDNQRRATNQWATVGPDLRLVRNATFIYTNNFNLTNLTATLTGTTTVLDYTNNPTTYFYTNSLIRRVRDALGAELVQAWYEAGETNAPAYPRSLKTVTDKRGLVTSYFYDSRGNVTNTTMRGDLLGDGNTNTTAVMLSGFSTNNNLPEWTISASGTTNLFFYTNTWLLARQEIWPSNATPAQAVVNLYNYSNVTNADGTAAYGVRVMEVRAAGTSDAATNAWVYSSRGFPTQQTRYTGTADPNVVVTNLYNTRGELALQTDAAGRSTRLGFDPFGRPQSREVYESGSGAPVSWEFSYYNENGEPTWSDGPRYNPEDYVWRDYDGAGRLTTEIHWRSEAREDGTGVQAPTGDNLYATRFQQFDAFGNLTGTTDPRGNYSRKFYDVLGQLTREEFYSADGVLLATNGLAYNAAGDVTNAFNALGGSTTKQFTSTGKPKYHKNPDGSTNAWRYYADGRVRREIQRNGAYWETTYNDANRTSTRIFHSAGGSPLATNVTALDRRGNVFTRTDAAGNTFTNSFDGLDRLKWSAGPMIVFETPPDMPAPPGGPPPPIQQAVTNFYDAAGLVQTSVNAVGDQTITYFDALGRTTRTEVRSAANGLVRETTTAYRADHHGVTVTNGSGSGGIVSTSYTDNDGHTVLSIGYTSANAREFTRQEFDAAGNLTYWGRYSTTNGVLAPLWSGAIYAYDGLNRRTYTLDRDNAETFFSYNALGNLTNRIMPGGLRWQAQYNNAGQLLTSWNSSTNGLGTRTNSYAYFGAGNSFAGLQQSHTDGRGVVCSMGYDDFLRPTTNSYSGPLSEHDMDTLRQYDARGLLTQISEGFVQGTNGPSTLISRSYDPYGQLAGETISVNGVQHSTTSQQWSSAGRRDWMSFFNFSYRFGWQADGQMSSASAGDWANGSYGYSTAGLLNSRTMNGLSVNVTSRDGVGRILARTSVVNSETQLSETLAWTGDGLLSAHDLARTEDFTDNRSYDYATLSRRVMTERLKLTGSTGWTNVFGYDQGVSNGPGVLTRVAEPQAGGAEWTAELDGFNRIEHETNNVVRRPAKGRLNATPQYGTVSVALDGRALSVNTFNTGDTNWPTEWRTEMELRPGRRTLVATAQHSSKLFTTNSSVTFTNNALDQTTVNHFAEGQLSHRVWVNSLGQTNRVQTFAWDGRSRLIATTEVDDQNNGYNWTAVYDALGRRLKTTTVIVTNGFALTNQPKVIASYFDPGVEFLELGVNVSGKARWKVFGPDLNGSYGGMNGTGGFDGVVDDVGVVRPVVSDARGNVHGLFDTVEGVMQWNGSRPTGYGAVPEHRPLSLADNGDLGSASAWRGRWPDRSGLYWLGARYYDPVAGRFISCDPYGHDADPSLYAFADGDPINRFDPDGRLGKGAYAGWTDASVPANASSAFMAGYYGGGVAGGFQEGWQGGQQILANTFTFGGTDALGWTDTSQLQGWEYTGSRILATTGREALIGAATLGSFQMARYGSEGALYTYQGLQVMNAGRSGYAIGTGIDQVSQGNNWGYLNIGAGTLGLAGGFTMAGVAPELNTLGGFPQYSGPVPPVLPAVGQPVYGALDQFGRPTGAYATIDQSVIGTGTRASQSITPPGYVVDAGLARGHLIGRQLGGAGDDARNLATILQNPANHPVMSGFEGQVRAAAQAGQTINYSVTPVYQGVNSIPSGFTIMGQGNGGFQMSVTVLNR